MCPFVHLFSGVFPLTSTSLMTQQERQQFLPIVRSFTAILEKGSANADEANALLAQATQLSSLLPANFRNSIQALTTGFSSGRIGDIDFSNLGNYRFHILYILFVNHLFSCESIIKSFLNAKANNFENFEM